MDWNERTVFYGMFASLFLCDTDCNLTYFAVRNWRCNEFYLDASKCFLRICKLSELSYFLSYSRKQAVKKNSLKQQYNPKFPLGLRFIRFLQRRLPHLRMIRVRAHIIGIKILTIYINVTEFVLITLSKRLTNL